jgi:hypothetical protein
MTKPLIAREPKWSVYVDSEEEAVALLIAMNLRHRPGQIQAGYSDKPKLIREIVDISLFKNPQDYQGTRYWIV